jgi:hypothetical protein
MPPLPIGGAQPQPIIRRSFGAKPGVNLLGEIEKWALPDAQKVTQAILTLSGVSVKELRDLCIKLLPKLQAECIEPTARRRLDKMTGTVSEWVDVILGQMILRLHGRRL